MTSASFTKSLRSMFSTTTPPRTRLLLLLGVLGASLLLLVVISSTATFLGTQLLPPAPTSVAKTLAWTNPIPGTYPVTINAQDTNGNPATQIVSLVVPSPSSTPTPTPTSSPTPTPTPSIVPLGDVTPPVVSITSSNKSNGITLTVSATDPESIVSSVKILGDSATLKTCTSTSAHTLSCTTQWRVSGTHTVTGTSTNSAGLTGSASKTVTR